MRRRLFQFGLGDHAEALLGLGLPSIRLHPAAPRELSAGGLPIGTSKLGGRPDLAQGTSWPIHDGRPLQFMAQIRLADLAGLEAASVLPDAGLLTFFYDQLEGSRGTVSVVDLERKGAPLVRLPLPDALLGGVLHDETGVVVEHDFTLFPWAPDFLDEDEKFSYRDLIRDDEVHHRMLGYPDLIQDTPTPGASVLLLQLDFYDRSSFPGGAGRLYFLLADDDLRHSRFNEAIADYECD